jgi:hypothetical protein
VKRDDLGHYAVQINGSATIIVEQVEDEINVIIASVVGVDICAISLGDNNPPAIFLIRHYTTPATLGRGRFWAQSIPQR